MKMHLALILIGVTAAGSVLAQAPAKADPAKARQIASQVCAACHGADGNSTTPVNPSLAGQHGDYIAKQLADFKANKERKNPIMVGMATTLSADDMKALGQYFEQQKAKPGSAKDKSLVVLGQKLYRGGNSATGVAACAACHAPNGAGVPAQFPRLAGQSIEYTLAQLHAFRTEERANDPGKMMRAIAGRMSDKEMRAVAEYIAGLR
jgi:cytochrome c553